MRTAASLILALLLATAAHAQTTRPPITATACKKPSGINVLINLDARPTTFAKGAQQVHISPALSLDFISRFEAKLDAAGYCIFHNDEFDGAGRYSVGILPGTTPHVDITFLAHVESFPDSAEFLVYSMHSGDWTAEPLLPYYLLDGTSDIAGLSQTLANEVKAISTQ
ncbi:MAG: hypothetical protein WA875_14530 [Candidatus Acidiferrales bacterium]